ncbi:hypothetical protein H6G35_09965, partial [Aulosira sp. FACHB-113]|nr:hypothetical protein [Aulosira sp. FACHB-113]
MMLESVDTLRLKSADIPEFQAIGASVDQVLQRSHLVRYPRYLCIPHHKTNTSPNTYTSTGKGLPNKKISQYLLWGGHLVRPVYVAGKMPAPQDGIIYFLEIP